MDVCEYYPSISKKLLNDAVNWASQIVEITSEEKEIILSSKKSFLYKDGVAYRKKTGNDFDVTMGSFDGAETSDIVGLFLLNEVEHLDVQLGCFRDDWLGFSKLTARQTDNVKKKIQKIFEKHGLKIDLKVNKNVADYLDVTFDMKNESFKPFTKPNHIPRYVHTLSNHPPAIIKNIPLSVNERLVRLSSSKEIFESAAPLYQRALEASGYDHKLKFYEIATATKAPGRCRNRSRRVTYFNPPFSLTVASNIGKEFLDIVRKFPKNNILSSIVNTNTVKVSYRTLKNMGGEISRHNSNLLMTDAEKPPPPRCNCRAALKPDCPMPNYCTVSCVVYRAKVTKDNRQNPAEAEFYTGLTEGPIKKRIKRHYSDIERYRPLDPENHQSGTRLSRYCGNLAANNIPYSIAWDVICETKVAFNPLTSYCKLCTMEKYFIMFKPEGATINLRSEFFNHCRHKVGHLLRK